MSLPSSLFLKTGVKVVSFQTISYEIFEPPPDFQFFAPVYPPFPLSVLQYHKKLPSHTCHLDQILFQNNIDTADNPSFDFGSLVLMVIVFL